MNDFQQKRFSITPRLIRNIGIVLFLLSFILPPGRAHFVPTEREHAKDYLQPFAGVFVFIETPLALTFVPLSRGEPFDNGLTPYEIFTRGIIFAAWLVNFTVFFRVPTIVALLVICLPWLAFIFWFDLMAAFIPFYFWALGIALIHSSRILSKWPKNQP